MSSWATCPPLAIVLDEFSAMGSISLAVCVWGTAFGFQKAKIVSRFNIALTLELGMLWLLGTQQGKAQTTAGGCVALALA